MLERPNTAFRIYRSPTVGDNQAGGIGAMRLAGSRIRGVVVDNPSGAWVKLDGPGLGFQPYIAPYTLAWSISLLPSVDELSATYVVGPTGQPLNLSGAPIVVYLFEAQVPSSAGSSFQQSSYDKTFSAANGAKVAQEVVIGAVPVASAITTVSLSIMNRIAGTGIGATWVYLDDGVGGTCILLGSMVYGNCDPKWQTLVYPEPFVPPGLSRSVGGWSVVVHLQDFGGVNQYDFVCTINYR